MLLLLTSIIIVIIITILLLMVVVVILLGRSQVESALLFLLLLSTLLFSYLAFVEPLSRSMAEVKMELRSSSRLYYTILYYTILYYIILYYIIMLYYIVLYYIILVEKELCGGNQTFVVAENTETQLVVGLVTQEAWQTAKRTVVEEAVERHKFSQEETSSTPFKRIFKRRFKGRV